MNLTRKLNLAVIGVGGRGKENLGGAFTENVIAICDTDDAALARALERCGSARGYSDYRQLLTELHDRLDAVIINTPDHTHYPIAMEAMELGIHVYCEKPLAHSVRQAREMARKAAEKQLITSMGNQMHSCTNYRRVVEIIQSGALGKIQEVHVWCGKGWGGNSVRPNREDPVPAAFHWNEWLGPAPKRPYAERLYHPANWRRWWDFGSGTLGDMGCHYFDLVFWALGLKSPKSVQAWGPNINEQTEMAPYGLKIEYEFLHEGKPLKVFWYDGDIQPEVLEKYGLTKWLGGVFFIGTEGAIQADYTKRIMAPVEKFENFKEPAPWIPDSKGHFADFFNGIRTQTLPPCHFGYSGPLTETILLGVAAYRSQSHIEWDSENLRAVENPEAQIFIDAN